MKLLLTGDSIIARSENHSIPEINFQLQKLNSYQIYNTAISNQFWWSCPLFTQFSIQSAKMRLSDHFSWH